MNETTSFKRLVLRAVLRQVSPMVIRLVAVSDQVDLPQFHDIFRAILGWNSDVGYLIRVHGQEFNSFHRKTRCKALHEFKLNRREEFLYVCDTLHMSEWDVRVLDIQDGAEGEHVPFCLDGRGATPSESCGGPTGAIERQELTMERLGMSLAESKALLEGAQKFLIVKQASEGLGQRRACADCGQRHTTKDAGTTPVKTLFGPVAVPNPRWNRCPCQTHGPRTFRPTKAWLHGRTSAEMLYLETKWLR